MYGPVGCNIFQLQLTGSEGVPVNQANVQKMMKQRLTNPREAEGSLQQLHVGFMQADARPDQAPANAKVLSAEEINYALLFRIAERVGQLATQEEMEEWRALAISYPVVYECHTSADAMHWRSVNIREEYATSFDLLSRSMVQKLFELVAFKAREEQKKSMTGSRGKTTQLSSKVLYELWSANVKFSTLNGDDNIPNNEMSFKLGFVEACVLVYNRLLVYPGVRKSVLEAEDGQHM